MKNSEIEGGDEDPAPPPRGRQYRPVVAHDHAVVEMSSISGGSSSGLPSPEPPFGTIKANSQSADLGSNMSAGSPPPPPHADPDGRESKLELFGFDSLVNILGLRSMTGEQVPAPIIGQDGEDVSITHGQPRVNKVKLGTLMGVFVPCLQNILGIIYYIRFSWIVGMAGISDSLLLVSLCGLCTFSTSLSLSAIATNGAMKGGGPYYLIGRALGPEVGVSIGLCFFLGNAVAGAIFCQWFG